MSAIDKINLLIKERGITGAELTRAIGIRSTGTYSQWNKGTTEISNKNLKKIADFFGVPVSYLVDDISRVAPQEADAVPPGFSPLPEMAQVPLVGRIACGTPITAEQNVEQIVSIPAAWRATFTLMCKGNSMAPRIQDGDLVAVRSQPEVENGEIAAVRIGEEATLKHVYVYPNYIELRPENPECESIIKIGPDMADVVIEGKAVGICRGI